jgi:hypothetical protein
MFSERKKIIQALLLVVCTATFWVACKKNKSTTVTVADGNAKITYTESVDDFANPERGFYRFTETRASVYTPLVQSQLQLWRGLSSAGSGSNYQVYSTLVYRNFILDIFKNAPLSAAFLQAVKNDFDIARAAGVKLIPRFFYTNTVTAGSCPEQWICAPYGDAPKNIVLQHLAQLKPVFADAADVIAVVQTGLMGMWGENYYTDYFGDASQNGQGKLLDNNWLDRNEVVTALLDAVPKDRMIQVRFPQMKQRFLYGVNATVNALSMTESEAFNGSDKARIGFHNDCFLAGTDDYGTYMDYGNSSTPRQPANTVLRNFTKADSKYVAVGGETCDDAYSPQNDCEPAGMAETEMAAYHYSFLNSGYNNTVNNDWQTNGCMLNIRKKLGYRFVLKELLHPKEIKSGSSLPITLTVNNIGYASPFNERPVKLILKNSSTGQEFVYTLSTDIRKWFSGVTKIETSVSTSASLTAAVYDMYLFMPDKYTSIATRPEYAIQLANTDVWDAATGYNKLLTTIKVN